MKRTATRSEQLTTYRVVLLSILVTLLGLFLSYIATSVPSVAHHDLARLLLADIGPALLVIGGINLLWELSAKRGFAEELLEKVQLSSEVSTAGLQRIIRWQQVEPHDWANFFSRAKDIEVFLSWGSSWRHNNVERLRTFCREPGHTLNVYLPDPEDDEVMTSLARRNRCDPADIKRRVQEAAREFAALQQQGGATVKVYLWPGEPLFCCYRFDSEIVVTLYSHQHDLVDVPTLILRSGHLLDYFRAELNAIRSDSREYAASP